MKKVKAYVISFAVLLAAWQLLAMSGLFPSSLFPSPVQAAQALIRRAASGALILDIGASMYRFLLDISSQSYPPCFSACCWDGSRRRGIM